MGDRKLAVIFPGVGYHGDKPLLYYSKKLATQKGIEILGIEYDIMPSYEALKDDKYRDETVIKMATDEAMKKLSEVSLDDYCKVFFIGKSFGTVVAGCCDKLLNANARHIVLTPVPETFKFLNKGCGIVFHGTKDPLCDNDIAEKECKELELELIEIEGANHSLEVNNVAENLRIMERVMERVEKEMGE